ncbi:ATP-dependent protease ClpP protease subunit [Azospirillum fermentarium]|uniref:ATP-dependent Clp protease proteolytic subunit n=1 Tax=Azospirillum fermentarium TaxID=1233114 RepID=UPI0022273038|nr:ATP-dependent Clp protease proteolytic subunit [Azospirillum fermentarium]MCW2246370.1 ATP-dependent protease ClpP protease subunit [Azospirillum fermentarium]
MMRRTIVSTIVASVVLGATLAFGLVERAAADNTVPGAVFPDATLTVSEQGGGTLIRIDGIITPAVEERFVAALTAVPARRPVMVDLSSPGGFTAAGYRMIDTMLAERGNGRPLATRVGGGERCESMCVGIYLAGYPRFADPSASFMVHAPRMAEDGRMTVRTTQIMVKRLLSLGASPDWIAQVKAAGGFSGAQDYRLTAAALTAANANIVTDLIR